MSHDLPPQRAARFVPAVAFDAAWLLFWTAVSSAWCLTAASQLSATFDEPTYVQRGLERWRSGSTAQLMHLGTMPLPVDVETLPLYVWERWHGVPLDPVGRLHQLLPWARAFALLFWWLLLFYAWRAARSLGGPWAGRLAVALLACEPIFLANAALSTTDIAVAACLLAFLYHFRAGRDGAWMRRIGWPALWFAAAVLAKASGLVFGVLCMIVIEAERRLAVVWDKGEPDASAPWGWKKYWAALRQPKASGGPCPRRTFRSDFTQIVLIGTALVFVYCGSDWQPQTSGLAWARQLPNGLGRTALVGFFEAARVFPNAAEGVAHQVTHNLRGAGVYILGCTHSRYLWFYFPVALSIKLSEPLLLAPVLLLALRPRSLRNWAALCALVLLLFSFNAHVQIGVRFMLPMVALAVVGLSAAAVQTARSFGPGWRARAVKVGCAAAFLWSGASAWATWPNDLCYINHLWGNPAEGDRLVSDANWDWGQGLKELAQWKRRHGAGELDVWYFGLDPTIHRMPLRPLLLQELPITAPADVPRYVRGRRLAVSTSLVHGCLADAAPAARFAQAFLATQRPADRTSTFLIYDFTHLETSQGSAGTSRPTPDP